MRTSSTHGPPHSRIDLWELEILRCVWVDGVGGGGFSTLCSNTTMAWHYSWYLFRLRPPASSSRFFHIYPYARASFSGPCRCVWVSRSYSFDARNPALRFVYLGGLGYTHLRGPVSRFGGTLFLTRDPKKWMGAWGVPVHLHGVLDNEPHRTKDV